MIGPGCQGGVVAEQGQPRCFLHVSDKVQPKVGLRHTVPATPMSTAGSTDCINAGKVTVCEH